MFGRGETFEGLEAFGVVVGIDEVFEVLTKFVVSGVVVAFECGLPECRVHPFDLSVGPRMVRFGERGFDAVFPAAHVEHVGDVPGCGAVFVTQRKGELDAIVCKDGVDLVGNGFDEILEEGSSCDRAGLLLQLAESKLRTCGR